MRKPLLAAVLSLLAGLEATGVARADLVSIVSNHDNTLYENAAGDTSNGAGVYMFVGETNSAGTRRGLLSFDVAAAIPAGATINSVTLKLQMTRTRAGTVPIGVHRVQDSWGEGTSDPGSPGGIGAPATPGDATWRDRFFGSTGWNAPGGDFDAAELSTLPVANIGSYTWPSSAAFVALVQDWLVNPSDNFGVLLLADESIRPGAKRFATRETSIASQRPTLIVDYTPVPCPGTLGALASGAIVLARRRRK